jgi:hypothetical protein
MNQRESNGQEEDLGDFRGGGEAAHFTLFVSLYDGSLSEEEEVDKLLTIRGERNKIQYGRRVMPRCVFNTVCEDAPIIHLV